MEDERHDDDLDALREMECGQVNANVLVDSQLIGPDSGAAESTVADNVDEKGVPRRAWKKRGQKRTTRTSKMRPVRMKPKDENKFVAQQSESESEDELAAVEETQLIARGIVEEAADEEEQQSQEDGDDGPNDGSNDEFDDNDYNDELQEGKKREVADESRLETVKATKSKSKDKDKQKQKKGPTINPNAVSHMNFRSLKIKNKNSKAKGRGRFGRKGR